MTNKSTKIVITVIALIVGLVVGYAAFHRSAPAPTTDITSGTKRVGGGDPVEVVPVTFVNGLNNGDSFYTYKSVFMNRGANQFSWQNTTGRTVYVSDLIVKPLATTTGTTYDIVASTTMKLSVGTSTAATVTDAITSPVVGTLIDSYSIATSTVLTSVAINSYKDAGTNGRQVIPVLPGVYLVGVLWSPAFGNQSSYSSATTSDRGYNFKSTFRYSY